MCNVGLPTDPNRRSDDASAPNLVDRAIAIMDRPWNLQDSVPHQHASEIFASVFTTLEPANNGQSTPNFVTTQFKEILEKMESLSKSTISEYFHIIGVMHY